MKFTNTVVAALFTLVIGASAQTNRCEGEGLEGFCVGHQCPKGWHVPAQVTKKCETPNTICCVLPPLPGQGGNGNGGGNGGGHHGGYY